MMVRMIRKIAALAGAAGLLFLCSSPVRAIDGVAVEAGRGDDRTSVLRVALTDYWRKRLPPDDVWRLAGYWEVSAGLWDNPDDSTADIGITPVFRVQYQRFYVEGAIGLHFVSTHISHSRVFSTVVQFGDHVGAGMRLGREGRYDLGLRLQHLSNGSLKQPNPGINFVLLRLQYLLE
jgi:lipid A 3-O-deacylase